MQGQTDLSSRGEEFAIYTYDLYDPEQFGINKWQKFKSLPSFDRALKEAKVLFRSNRFQKVEIKQRYHDQKLKRSVSKTLKIFEKRSSQNLEKYGYVLAASVLVLSLLGFSLF